MPSRIEDYALIGDTRTAALVGRDGSIDWLCLPDFADPSVFAALLGTEDHGRWQLAPEGTPTEVARRYRGDTLVLETTFTTDTGVASVIDFMPVRQGPPMLVRVVVGRTGTVRMVSDLRMRFDYGSIVPWVRRIEGGLIAEGGRDGVVVRADVPMEGRDHRTEAVFDVSAGRPAVLHHGLVRRRGPGAVGRRLR